MIKEVNQVCGKLNEALGFSVKLPNPGKKAVKSAALCNLIAGAGLIAAGAAFSSKWGILHYENCYHLLLRPPR